MNAFARYIGIDYPGAETPSASLKGLRVYMADRNIAIDPNDLKAHGRPSRGGRGSKHRPHQSEQHHPRSPLTRGRGLKRRHYRSLAGLRRRPSRGGRGSKPDPVQARRAARRRPSRGGSKHRWRRRDDAHGCRPSRGGADRNLQIELDLVPISGRPSRAGADRNCGSSP